MESLSESSPAASAETTAGTPSESVPSTSTTEASAVSAPNADIQPTGTETGQSVLPELQSGETVAGSQDEFPDDAAFLQLPGEQRASNWSKARGRISELNQKVAELSGLESLKPVSESIEQMGGWDRVEPLMQLANGLFTPQVDPDTNELVTDPQTGLPKYTAYPFVEQLVQQSPNTLAEIVWRALDEPLGDNETFGHWVMRERLGLDPNMLATYQQIQSPQQAAAFIAQSGGVDPTELESVPAEYHNAYKSLTPHLREEYALMGEEAKRQVLEERKELLESRQFREQQKAHIEQQRKQQEAQWQQQVHQAGERLIGEVRDRTINTQYDKLKAEAVFFPDEADNKVIWDETVNYAVRRVEQEPTLQTDLQRCDQLYRLSAYHGATGDQWKAKQSKVEADKLATKLDARFRNYVTERVGWWSKRLGAARTAHQQQVNNAQPRAEIASNGSNAQPVLSNGQVTAPTGQRFGLSQDRINQLAAQLALKKSGQA